ncbi:hypothetical protein ACFXG1_00810 [Streptomyces sp. NPDC059248]|uniref:hypothetical protein n=1 Tax=Streptomyces sp. NPDC059248 TaxID=3346791 RepID=UPI0036B5CABC
MNNGPEHEHDEGAPDSSDAPESSDASQRLDPPDAPDTPDSPDPDTAPAHASGPGPVPGSEPELALDLDLGRLFHDAVDDLRPADNALHRLRTAVPARRARKRQMLIGAVAAVVLTGTAVPALVHVADTSGSDRTNTANASHNQPTGGQEGGQPGTTGDREGPARPSATPSKGKENLPDKRPGDPSGSTGGETGVRGPKQSGGVDGGVIAADPPACGQGQLRIDTEGLESMHGDGVIYGSFRVVNSSDTPCEVRGEGELLVGASGDADMSKIQVVEHIGGDAASSGLPDPSAELASVALKPGDAYRVRFGFVPGENCPTGNPSPDPTATEGATGGGAENPGGAPPAEGENQPGPNEPPTAPVVLVHHTTENGVASADAQLVGYCSGTIYRTGILAD